MTSDVFHLVEMNCLSGYTVNQDNLQISCKPRYVLVCRVPFRLGTTTLVYSYQPLDTGCKRLENLLVTQQVVC